jgi:hypothetical protein
MEAALWGRVEKMLHLLRHGANKTLCRRQAVDFAAQSLCKYKEQYTRAGGPHWAYRGKAFQAERAREMIRELLQDAERCSSEETLPHKRNFISLVQEDGPENLSTRCVD